MTLQLQVKEYRANCKRLQDLYRMLNSSAQLQSESMMAKTSSAYFTSSQAPSATPSSINSQIPVAQTQLLNKAQVAVPASKVVQSSGATPLPIPDSIRPDTPTVDEKISVTKETEVVNLEQEKKDDHPPPLPSVNWQSSGALFFCGVARGPDHMLGASASVSLRKILSSLL